LLATNATVTATEALALGLTNRVAPAEQFDGAWRAWAALFAAGPRDAIALMKQNVRQAMVEPLATALPDESLRMAMSARTADHKEAVRAWIAKREPDFRRPRPDA